MEKLREIEKKLRMMCHNEECTHWDACPQMHELCAKKLNLRTSLIWTVADVCKQINGYDLPDDIMLLKKDVAVLKKVQLDIYIREVERKREVLRYLYNTFDRHYQKEPVVTNMLICMRAILRDLAEELYAREQKLSRKKGKEN